MSGTSLDGLDLALCEFVEAPSGWEYRILRAETRPYTEEWRLRLSNVHTADALTFWKTHVEYGRYLGTQVREFLSLSPERPDVVCSHGHTVFHRPDEGYTMQIGAGEVLAAVTRLPVIYDFRSVDVALGGQGAPLVPMGDKLLFGDYPACLNIGGIANISFDREDKRIAFDICPANMVLNTLASRLGQPFDRDGLLASSGKADPDLLSKLNNLKYYKVSPPKSLGREWVEEEFFPLLDASGLEVKDLLRTCCEHVGVQAAGALAHSKPGRVLVTGGGARNTFLLETLRRHSSHDFIIPDPLLIDFKEALVFAFLGVLRLTGNVNTLSSVTGSAMDHSGGVAADPFPSRRQPRNGL